MKKLSAALLSLASLLLFSNGQVAAEGVSNLLNSVNGYADLARNSYAPFTVGANSVYLDYVQLAVLANNFDDDNTDGTVTYNAFIYSDNAGTLGGLFASVGNFVDVSLVGDEVITINAVSSITLTANTTYWLLANVNSDDVADWVITSDIGQSGDPGWSIGDGGLVETGGPTFAPTTLKFAINATPVPEPSSAALLAVSLVACSRRSRRRKSPPFPRPPGWGPHGLAKGVTSGVS